MLKNLLKIIRDKVQKWVVLISLITVISVVSVAVDHMKSQREHGVALKNVEVNQKASDIKLDLMIDHVNSNTMLGNQRHDAMNREIIELKLEIEALKNGR